LNKVFLAILVTVSFSVLVGSQEAFAAAKTWDGGAGTLNWSDGANWDPDGVPLTNDIITIPSPFDVTLDIDFTVGNSGTLTIDSGASLLVDKNKKLLNFNQITNAGDLVIDGKVETSDTLTNQATGTIDILGDGSADNGVFINKKTGTVNDFGAVKSVEAQWMNSGTYNKKGGTFDLFGISDFTNDDKGILNIIGDGTTSPRFLAINSIMTNTGESKINIGTAGRFDLADDSSLENKLLSEINVNDGGIFSIINDDPLFGVLNESKVNVNAGGIMEVGSVFTGTFDNIRLGVLTIQGGTGNPARVDIEGVLTSSSEINNNSDGIIDIFPQGILQNISPGSITNNKGAVINVQKTGQDLGHITGNGGVINRANNSIVNFGLIDISGPWQNFGKIENEGIINVLCGGSIDPLGTIIGSGEFNEFGCPIGGTFVPIDTTTLLLAGVQSISMWLIPVVAAGVGIGVFVIIRRK